MSGEDGDLAKRWEESLGTHKYRWVMLSIWLIMMTINSISLVNYPLALPSIAKQFNVPLGTFSYYLGVLSYSLGLFIIYFGNIGGWMNSRVRFAVILSQLFLIITLFLIPIAQTYDEVVVLRFIQGLWFMELGLATLNLRGWFNKNEIAIAMAAPLSALQFGSALGGLLEKTIVLQIGWKAAFMITGIIDVMATILFLALYRDAEGYNKYLAISRRKNMELRGTLGCPHPSRLLVSYSIGFSQMATTMAFASIPYLVPTYGYFMKYNAILVSNTVLIYGIISGIGIWGGAILGSMLVRSVKTAKETFIKRNMTRTISYIISFIGFLILLLFRYNYLVYTLGAVLSALILFNIPNYWAEMVEVVPPGISGDFVFFAGAIASSGFFLGPLISVYLIITAHGDVIEGFALFLVIIAISGIINILQNKARLPIEKYRA